MASAPVSFADGLGLVLDASQREELAKLQTQFARPRELGHELVRRGWLTFFQANLLLQGKANDLILGQYILLEKIGEGGMGQVYKARQKNLDRIVALKVIRKECIDNPKVISRFQREIRLTAQLAHPNIVRAYDADQVGSRYFIAMEFIDGVDLARMVKDQGPLPVAEACEYIRQAALGLQHALERGMVHRDIKPANLLVSLIARSQESGVRGQESGARRVAKITGTRDVGALRKALRNGTPPVAGEAKTATPEPRTSAPVVKILDLGLARWDDAGDGRACTHLTQMGSVMGTPDFIAPEQARNSHTCDIRADLYSLGCTLYYILAGRVPFVGGSFAEKLIQHQMDEPAPLAEIRRSMLQSFHVRKGATKISRKLLRVPEAVVAVVAKLMAKKPEDRYQTPDEAAEALEQVLTQIAAGQDSKAEAAEGEVETPLPSASPVAPTLEPPFAEPLIQPPLAPVALAPLVKMSAALRQRAATVLRRRWAPFGVVAAAVLIGLILAAFNNGPRPQASPPQVDDAAAGASTGKKDARDDAAWRAIEADVQQKKLSANDLRAKLLDYKRQHPARAREVSALLQKVASPFDAFERAKIEPKQWYAWMPDELVGILGIWRGLPGGQRSHSVAVSPDGKWVAATGEERALRVWDAGASPLPWRVDNANWARVTRAVFSPDGNLIAVACDDGIARLYDAGSRKPLHALQKHKRAVTCLAFHPERPLLATAGSDGVVILWNTANAAAEVEIQTNVPKISALAFTPDGGFVFWGGDNQEVQWANLAGHNPKHWKLAPEIGTIKAIAFHPDGDRFVVGASTGQARLGTWDGTRAKVKAELDRHTDCVNEIAFAPDGLSFITASDDKHLILWDAATGEVKKSWDLRFPVHGVVYAPDGRHVLTANGNGTVFVLRLAESARVAQAR